MKELLAPLGYSVLLAALYTLPIVVLGTTCTNDARKSLERDRARLDVVIKECMASGETCYNCKFVAMDNFGQPQILVAEYVCK
jgi:hypothetical protein